MTNFIKKIMTTLALGMVLTTPALAGDGKKIQLDPGGSIVEYIEKYNDIRETQGRLVIDGPCISACTLVLGLVPNEQVCATPFGLMAFHSASIYNGMTGERKHSETGTRLIWNIYPKTVREKLKEAGWDGENPKLSDHNELIYFPATDFFKPCGG